MTTDRTCLLGSKPHWVSSDGKRCYVSNSESNDLSVVDSRIGHRSGARVPVGKYPQRSRLATVPAAVIDNSEELIAMWVYCRRASRCRCDLALPGGVWLGA